MVEEGDGGSEAFQNCVVILKGFLLEIDIEAFRIRYRPKGITHKKQGKRKKFQLQESI